MNIAGIISTRHGPGNGARVIAVGKQGAILAEVQADIDGQWSLEVVDSIEWVISQLLGARFAAVAVPLSDSERIEMPDLVQLDLEFDSIPEGASFWLDPVDLEEFPPDLLWTLRTHANGIIDLHVAEFPVSEAGLQLQLQRGTYRLSGGRISIHPITEVGQGNILLSYAMNKASGASIAALNGEVILDVYEDASFRLGFA